VILPEPYGLGCLEQSSASSNVGSAAFGLKSSRVKFATPCGQDSKTLAPPLPLLLLSLALEAAQRQPFQRIASIPGDFFRERGLNFKILFLFSLHKLSSET